MATVAVSGVRRAYSVTPEIYFPKAIDNSRLVRVTDPARQREMRMFMLSLASLFVLFMVFCWQHYSAIEYGYRNEALRVQRDQLLEQRRQLQLDEASLKEPWRIDALAHQLGLQATMAGQVANLELPPSTEHSAPVIARVATISVVSATQ